jgi:hypothetical protein
MYFKKWLQTDEEDGGDILCHKLRRIGIKVSIVAQRIAQGVAREQHPPEHIVILPKSKP